MRIKYLEITNFRGIKKILLDNLKDLIVIAGPNGSGKSSIFDAIRLIKSVYGGYQGNEMDLWFGEFQIDAVHRSELFKGLYRDNSQDLKIKLEIELEEPEGQYVRENIRSLIKPKVVSQYFPEFNNQSFDSFAHRQRINSISMEEKLAEEESAARLYLQKRLIGEIVITPDFKLITVPNPALEVIFSTYDPDNMGIIDYNGAARNYGRERVGGITLSNEDIELRMSQHALYNYAGKYSNIKSEMAAVYLRDLIKKDSGIAVGKNMIIETVKDLFKIFFPGKEFLGPIPNQKGSLDFPIRLATGEIHDIDELSSGEKEIIYGYLRLRNNTPKNSVLLIDEPELHLNPSLIRGLPEFYKRHLGEAMGNQMWLITHSDAFLRETVGRPNYSTYHLKFADESPDNQIKKVEISADLETAVLDLVGDLAAYHPGAKVVILEGGGDSEFDLKMVTSLFPDFANKVNLISGGMKGKVIELHKMLSEVADKGMLPMKFFAIVDWDREDELMGETASIYKWDVYHIENYLLEEKYILYAIRDLALSGDWDEKKVKKELKNCAKELLGELVHHKITKELNEEVVSKIEIGANPKSLALSKDIYISFQNSVNKIIGISEKIQEEDLIIKEKGYKKEFLESIRKGSWKKEFRGRDILKRFLLKNFKGMKYEYFRNLIISRMVTEGYKPRGMEDILKKI